LGMSKEKLLPRKLALAVNEGNKRQINATEKRKGTRILRS